MRTVIIKLLQQVSPDGTVGGLEAKDTAELVTRWTRCGKNLNIITTKFGNGSVFFLTHVLTPNFRGVNFLGKPGKFDEAMEHLDHLGLKNMAEESGANEVASAMREFMLAPFEDINNRF